MANSNGTFKFKNIPVDNSVVRLDDDKNLTLNVLIIE